MSAEYGPKGGRPGGQRLVLCSRCRRPISGPAWRSLTGRVLHPKCTQGATYLSDQLLRASQSTDEPSPERAARGWRRALRRKG